MNNTSLEQEIDQIIIDDEMSRELPEDARDIDRFLYKVEKNRIDIDTQISAEVKNQYHEWIYFSIVCGIVPYAAFWGLYWIVTGNPIFDIIAADILLISFSIALSVISLCQHKDDLGWKRKRNRLAALGFLLLYALLFADIIKVTNPRLSISVMHYVFLGIIIIVILYVLFNMIRIKDVIKRVLYDKEQEYRERFCKEITDNWNLFDGGNVERNE